MSGFVMHLLSAGDCRRIEGVRSFVGEDASGAFGLLPRHERFMTPLVFGLARFLGADGSWQYLATVGGIAYFSGGELSVSTRRFLLNADYSAISAALGEELTAEEKQSRELRDSLHRIQEAMLRRLWQLRRGEGGAA